MVVAAASKKTSRKAALKAKPAEKVARKPHHPTHPPWIDMIMECITTTPDGTRQGVSRPAIKKFVDSKYNLPMDAADASRLNRAISQGAERGDFVLPKGPSGKIKLAPKRAGGIAKENKKPFVAHPADKKPKETAMKPSIAAKTKAPAVIKEKAPTKAASTLKKYVSKAKKSRITPIPGRQIPSRKTTSKRGRAKKSVTGSKVTKSRMAISNAASASRKRTSKNSEK